jgi:formate dehydrogenase iron-sulfur subunit
MLSDETYTYIDREGTSGQPRSVKRACMHCIHPACVAACTVGALKRTAEGLVVADTDKCIGCRYCQYACPFGVPQFEWEKPLGTIRKCTSCVERLTAGEQPACTANCASGALKFGTRGDLIKQAHMRIAAHPDFYVNHVYGESEVGGTTRLYISDLPFEELGLPTLDSEPAPRYAEAVMKQTPTIAVSVAALATGIYSVLKWRDKHAPHVSVKQEEPK